MSAALAMALARAAIAGANPRRCTREAITSVRSLIERPCTVLAFGKAARAMTEAALDELEVAGGIVIAGSDAPMGALRVLRGQHPTPAPDAAAHGAAVESLARSLGAEDVALVLISGGGSSMLELPAEGVTLDDIAETSRALMRAGADIAELNSVRRCLSRLKGGLLAEALFPARTIVIVISDVPGRDVSFVASGPCARTDGWPDARQVVAQRGVAGALSPSVRAAIARCGGPQVARGGWDHVHTIVAADVRTAIDGAVAEARRSGLRVEVADDVVAGEAREAGPRFVREARARCAARGIDGWIAGGETTVEVRGAGRGGRSSEAALAVACEGPRDGTFVAIATDGADGSSDSAAVWVDRDVITRAAQLGIDARRLLADNDSHAFFEGAGARLVTGPTGTNVADVWIWLER